MRTNRLFLSIPGRIAILAVLPFLHFTASAQVKIGSNPTTITSNTNLEVEANDGSQFVVKKAGGNVGVNTATPTDRVHVRAGSLSESVLLDMANGNSKVELRAEGGIILTRNGPAMPIAPHIGGYVDLRGMPGSPGWRMAQFPNWMALLQGNNDQVNDLPFYIHNGGRVSISTHQQFGLALLTVGGQIAGTGYSTRNGTGGANANNSFNISWDGSNARLWIDGTNQGIIQTGTSDYRLKKNVSSVTKDALSRIRQLRPVNFEYKDIKDDIFKSDHIKYEGFIAHELQAIIPSAVSGEKDALTETGSIQPQTVNALPIVAILTKAIQELEEKVSKLESENGQLRASAAELSSLTARLAEIEAKLPSTKLASNDGHSIGSSK